MIGNAALADIGCGTSFSRTVTRLTPSDRGASTASSATAALRSRRQCPRNARAGHPRDSRARLRRLAADGAVAADPVQFQRINKVFMLDEHFVPGGIDPEMGRARHDARCAPEIKAP
jgi:hypothetical protein